MVVTRMQVWCHGLWCLGCGAWAVQRGIRCEDCVIRGCALVKNVGAVYDAWASNRVVDGLFSTSMIEMEVQR